MLERSLYVRDTLFQENQNNLWILRCNYGWFYVLSTYVFNYCIFIFCTLYVQYLADNELSYMYNVFNKSVYSYLYTVSLYDWNIADTAKTPKQSINQSIHLATFLILQTEINPQYHKKNELPNEIRWKLTSFFLHHNPCIEFLFISIIMVKNGDA